MKMTILKLKLLKPCFRRSCQIYQDCTAPGQALVNGEVTDVICVIIFSTEVVTEKGGVISICIGYYFVFFIF